MSRNFIASFLRRAVYQDRSDQKLNQIRNEAYENGRQSVLKFNESLERISEYSDIVDKVEDLLDLHIRSLDISTRGSIIVDYVEKLRERAVSDPKWVLNELDAISESAKRLQRDISEFKKGMPANSSAKYRWL